MAAPRFHIRSVMIAILIVALALTIFSLVSRSRRQVSVDPFDSVEMIGVPTPKLIRKGLPRQSPKEPRALSAPPLSD